jgi:hypothetical protein
MSKVLVLVDPTLVDILCGKSYYILHLEEFLSEYLGEMGEGGEIDISNQNF